MYLLTRKFDILFQIIFALPCIFLFKVSRVSVLLIDNPLKTTWHGNFGSILDFPVTPSKSEIQIDCLSIGVLSSLFLRKKII